MKSGLEDRNNVPGATARYAWSQVSMKSGLEDRNNLEPPAVSHRLTVRSQ